RFHTDRSVHAGNRRGSATPEEGPSCLIAWPIWPRRLILSFGHSQRYFIWGQEFFATATIDTKPHERVTQRADRSNRPTHRMIALRTCLSGNHGQRHLG